MLIKPRLQALMKQNDGIKNEYLSKALRSWMLWQGTRDTFWYFNCLNWLNFLENDEDRLTRSVAPGILLV